MKRFKTVRSSQSFLLLLRCFIILLFHYSLYQNCLIFFSEESDFLSAFASPKVSQSKPTNEVESTTIDVKEDSAASRREKRMRNRRERSLEEEVSTPTEENVERNDVGKEKREMRLERLNDNSLDETPRRRRNRAQKALDSARSSADSSLVSTPDNDSAKVDLESRSKPTVESPDSETKAYSPSVTSQLDSPIPQSQEDAATSSNVDESVVVDEVTVSEPKPVETEEVDTYAVDDKPSSLPDEADAREPEAEQTPETKTEEVVGTKSSYFYKKIISLLHSRYYAEACNEWRGPSPRLSVWAL